MGRTAAFNMTLFLTSVFGVLAALANTFPLLCTALFLLGSAVGVSSLPSLALYGLTCLLGINADGRHSIARTYAQWKTIFGHCAISILFLRVCYCSRHRAARNSEPLVPTSSCVMRCRHAEHGVEIPSGRTWYFGASDTAYLQMRRSSQSVQTLVMFCARMVFFRLHESPRYLVHAGRHQEAIESLQMISKFNGSELTLDVDDVRDHLRPSEIIASNTSATVSRQPSPTSGEVVFNADDEERTSKDMPRPPPLVPKGSRQVLRSSSDSDPPDYSSTSETPNSLNGHTFHSPHPSRPTTPRAGSEDVYQKDVPRRPSGVSLDSARPSVHPRERSSSSLREVKSRLYWKLPRFISRPLFAWLERVSMVLSPEWMRTTILVWIVWCAMSLGVCGQTSGSRGYSYPLQRIPCSMYTCRSSSRVGVPLTAQCQRLSTTVYGMS